MNPEFKKTPFFYEKYNFKKI